MPVWTGPKTSPESFFATSNERSKTRFLILDPSHQLPEFAYRVTIYVEDQISVLDEQKKFGEIVVQKRHIPEDPKELKDTQKLTSAELTEIKTVLRFDDRYSCK